MSFERAWRKLPVVFVMDGEHVRWLGPLVDAGHDDWIGDLSNAAYSHLEDCGWMDLVPSVPATVRDGRLCAEWSEALSLASEQLALAGCYSGPESSAVRWASWLVFEWSSLHRLAQHLADVGETVTTSFWRRGIGPAQNGMSSGKSSKATAGMGSVHTCLHRSGRISRGVQAWPSAR